MEMVIENVSLELKKKLLSECLRLQRANAEEAKRAMDEAQESANEHQGAIEDKFESFRESCHIQRDMFAKQYDEAISGLHMLRRIVATKENAEVKLGSVVETTFQNYFISVSLGEITAEGKKYYAISTQSPLYQAIADKQKGDVFSFRGKEYKILNVF